MGNSQVSENARTLRSVVHCMEALENAKALGKVHASETRKVHASEKVHVSEKVYAIEEVQVSEKVHASEKVYAFEKVQVSEKVHASDLEDVLNAENQWDLKR